MIELNKLPLEEREILSVLNAISGISKEPIDMLDVVGFGTDGLVSKGVNHSSGIINAGIALKSCNAGEKCLILLEGSFTGYDTNGVEGHTYIGDNRNNVVLNDGNLDSKNTLGFICGEHNGNKVFYLECAHSK